MLRSSILVFVFLIIIIIIRKIKYNKMLVRCVVKCWCVA